MVALLISFLSSETLRNLPVAVKVSHKLSEKPFMLWRVLVKSNYQDNPSLLPLSFALHCPVSYNHRQVGVKETNDFICMK